MLVKRTFAIDVTYDDDGYTDPWMISGSLSAALEAALAKPGAIHDFGATFGDFRLLSPWDQSPSIVHVPTVFECPTKFVLADDAAREDGFIREQCGHVSFEGAAHDNAVVIDLDGFGLHAMATGFGGVVLVEFWDAEVRLLVWADINQEEPTHRISLEGAREFRRNPEDDDG